VNIGEFVSVLGVGKRGKRTGNALPEKSSTARQ